ncbi:hypothetical protein Tcan_16019 [Toxocara canis]|uniref:Uncharacterized protein n=1 Tax=Toxocara canis TaxID=6265 RepID=A0A0B2VZ05_TOXCA|nr:hypothetical protein Tcan_16019 [Toxocara canis]
MNRMLANCKQTSRNAKNSHDSLTRDFECAWTVEGRARVDKDRFVETVVVGMLNFAVSKVIGEAAIWDISGSSMSAKLEFKSPVCLLQIDVA